MARGLQVAFTTALDLWDRLAASDPGLERLTLAARGTLSVFLTTLAAMLATRLAGFSLIDFASGITLSLMAPFLMREPTRRQRQRGLLILPLPAAAAVVATTLLQGQGPVGDACFLALVFICFLVHPRNPRMIGVGLIAVVETYVGLYLDLPLSALPMQLLSLALAVPVIAFAGFVVLPMQPRATLRRTIAAVQGRAAQVLRTARSVADPRAMPDTAAAQLRRDLIRLNEAALAADDQLTLLQPAGGEAVRAALIDLELAAARLISSLGGAAPGPRHAARLVLHEQRMRRGRPYAMPPGRLPAGTMLASLVDLGHAMHALGTAMRSVDSAAAPSPPVAGQTVGPLAWRLASRVTLAAALAMAAGMALSPQRWFWAVMTVYVVFLNARSRGDTIYKGLQRLGGTVLGIASGLALATLLAGDAALQAAALLLSIFGMYYWFLTSYTAGIFCVTVMLGLLYGLLGTSLETLLVLRLEETAIGAAAAMLVAAFVLPIRTRDQVLLSGQSALISLVAAVRSIRQALAGCADAVPLEAMRRVDRQMADLRLALAPLTAARLLRRRNALEGSAPALLECVHWTRVLVACSSRAGGGRPGTPVDATLIVRAEAIEMRLAKLAAAGSAQVDSGQPDTTQADRRPARVGQDAMEAAMDMLEISVAILTEQMEDKALASFALGSP
jgi:uncharacterized membrane protein YccC